MTEQEKQAFLEAIKNEETRREIIDLLSKAGVLRHLKNECC